MIYYNNVFGIILWFFCLFVSLKSKMKRLRLQYLDIVVLSKGAFVLGENDFSKSFSPKPACLAATENEIFRKIISYWPTFTPLTRKWFYTHFHFKSFPEKEKEREKREPRLEREREEEETSLVIAPLVDRAPRRSQLRARSSIDKRRDRRAVWSSDKRARRTIAPISPLISPSPRNPIFSSAARSQFDRIWWIFLLSFVSFVNECGIDSLSACLQLRKCMENWACKAFSVKMFEWTKHRN